VSTFFAHVSRSVDISRYMRPAYTSCPERAILGCQPSHWRREAMKRAPYTKNFLPLMLLGDKADIKVALGILMISQLSDYMRQMFRSSTRLTGSGANFLNSTRPLILDASGTS